MTVDKKVPEIRFKGFSGEWENKLFVDCFSNVANNSLSRADLNYEHGIAKNIHYGDVLIKFGEILDVSDTVLPFITNENFVNKQKHAALINGDIVIADAAEDSTVGKCTELFNIGEEVILSGLHTIAVRPNFPFASKYLGYYLNSSLYHDQLLPLMQGTKVMSISKTALKNTNVNFPTKYEEQTAIGNYFQKLDNLINQHQQKHDKLNNIKKAMLEKMFPKQGKTVPEIRFKGFSGDWRYFTVGDCSSLITKGTTPMTLGRNFVERGVTFVKVESIDDMGNLNPSKFAFIDMDTDQALARSRIQENDLLISIAGALGRAAIVKKEILPANTNQAVAIVRLRNDSPVGTRFLYQFTKTKNFTDFVDSSASQGAQPNLSLGDMSKVKIIAPSSEEQITISNYFQKLDALINQHQQQITKLKNIKQACLSKMFV